MSTEARRYYVAGIVSEKRCPNGHLSWRRRQSSGNYFCSACKDSGNLHIHESRDMVVEREQKPKREPEWKRILREEGYPVKDSDRHPIDVRRRVLGLKNPDK